jgi:hypothetical protein
VSFDASYSKSNSFYISINYGDWPNNQELARYVTPVVVGSFRKYVIPLSSFTVWKYNGSPPAVPYAVNFGIGVYWPWTGGSWNFDADNVLLIDNFSYFVVPPPLSICSSNGNAIVSWAADTTPYVLEQNSDLNTTNWTIVTNLPSVSDGRAQVVVSMAAGMNFYRLRSP